MNQKHTKVLALLLAATAILALLSGCSVDNMTARLVEKYEREMTSAPHNIVTPPTSSRPAASSSEQKPSTSTTQSEKEEVSTIPLAVEQESETVETPTVETKVEETEKTTTTVPAPPEDVIPPASKPVGESTLEYGDEMNICDLTLLKADGYYYYSSGAEYDTYDNVYDTSLCFRNSDKTTMIYYTAGVFDVLEGTIAAHDDMDNDRSFTIKIFADNKEVYTSPQVNRTTKPFTISVDIKGCEQLTIQYLSSHYYYTDAICRFNVRQA